MTWQEALMEIEKKKGILNPEDIVSEAKKKTSPLHDKFTWNDSVAGNLYRIHQARNLIRIYVEQIPNSVSDVEHRVFVSLKEDRYSGGGYRTLVSVMEDTELRLQLLNEAKEELKLLKNKYEMLEELAKVFEEINKL